MLRAIMMGKSPSSVCSVTSSSIRLYRSARTVSARELNSAPCCRMEVRTWMKLVRVLKSSWYPRPGRGRGKPYDIITQ